MSKWVIARQIVTYSRVRWKMQSFAPVKTPEGGGMRLDLFVCRGVSSLLLIWDGTLVVSPIHANQHAAITRTSCNSEMHYLVCTNKRAIYDKTTALEPFWTLREFLTTATLLMTEKQ